MCYTVNNKKTKEEIAVKLKKRVLADDEVLKASFLSGFQHPKMYIVKQEQPPTYAVCVN